jgi:hypothetical protein
MELLKLFLKLNRRKIFIFKLNLINSKILIRLFSPIYLQNFKIIIIFKYIFSKLTNQIDT